jgi:RHS repeat-associated protein
MNALNSSLIPAKWLRLLALLTATGAMLPLDLHAINPGTNEPGAKPEAKNKATSDAPHDPSQKQGSDCNGSTGKQDPNSNLPSCSSGCNDPGGGSCISEEVLLGIAPNHPGLDTGRLKLYIDKTGSNLGSRAYLEFFGIPEMSVTEKNDQSSRSELGIMQAGGTRMMFDIASTRNPGASFIQGMPMGETAYSQARVSYVDSAGAFSERSGASFIRQFRAGAGTVDYPTTGGKATRFETRQGRVYTFPLNQMEVIRERSNGTYVINGDYSDALIRQVKTVAGLLDVVPLGERAYEIRKYAPQQVGAKSNGLFTATSDPYYKMKVEAPVDTQNKLTITVTEGSQVIVSNHTITLNGGAEEWVEEVTAGDFNYRWSLVKEPAPDLGAAYKRAKWRAYLTDGGPAALLQPGTGYEMDMVSYNNSMVSSTQKHSSGATKTRGQDLGSVMWDANGVGRPTGQQTSSGSSLGYSYDGEGRMTERSRASIFSFENGGSAPSQNREQFAYAPLRAGESIGIADFRPRTTTLTSGGTATGQAFFSAVHINGAYNEREERTRGATGSFGDPSNVSSEREWYGPGEHQGRIKFELKEDGTMERYEYVTKPGDGLEITTFKKLDRFGNRVNGYSTRVRELRDVRAWPIETTTAAWTGSAWVDYETIYQTRNEAGRIIREEREDKLSGQRRVTLIQEWDGPMLTRMVDEQGVATSYEYFNGTNVVKKVRREAIAAAGDFPAQPEIVTTYSGSFTMNQGQEPEWKTRTTTITAGDLTLTEQETFDEEGRIVSHTDKNGYTTTTNYNATVYKLANKVMTETLPSGATRITSKDSDGTLLSITGTAEVHRFFHTSPLAGGGKRVTVYFGSENSPRYETTDTDGAGRVVRKETPAFGGGTSVTTYTYSEAYPKSLEKVTKTGEATKFCLLNSIGDCIYEGFSADDDALTLNSATDRVTGHATTIEQDSNGLWKVVRDSVYPEAGSATAKVIKTTRTKLGGFTGTEIERTETADIAGNVTTERTLVSGTVREDRVARPGITGEEVAIRHGKRLMSVIRPGITGEVAFGYDALGRNVSRKEPRHTQASTTAYISGTNLLASQTDAAGNATSYSYYQQGVKGAGEVKSITLPDNSVKWTAYTIRDEVQAEWGSQTYPTWKEYDAYGKLVTLRTWQVAPTLNADSMPTTVPAGSAVTTWNYDVGTGLLANKRYADNKGPDYSYDGAGRLMTRLWARLFNGARLATHYTWNSFGELGAVDYADDTPDVAITYDRLGRITSQGNGVAVSVFSYSPITLRLSSEGITYDLNRDGTPELVRQLVRSDDTHLRSTGYQLKNGTTLEAQATYGYDNAGRIETVNGGDLGTFTYGYVPGSTLIGTVTGPVHTVTNTYEPNRDVLTLKQNKVGETVISAYGYTVNSLDQRTNVSQTGTAFASSRNIAWGYDALGQVISADSSETEHDRAYEYDMIGNRTKSANSLTLPAANNYGASSLNQYSTIRNLNPVYDEDGNATASPLPTVPTALSSLTWDGENRLNSAKVGEEVIGYHYDSWGWRIAQVANAINEMTIYDGWNPISRYQGPSLSRVQLWGLDLKGSVQNTGGIGGLLSISLPSVHFATYDSNGNVGEYIGSAGAVSAHFEYGPFGDVVANNDPANIYDIRFSTKSANALTGLYYYGYRDYDWVSGRWVSRDAIEESGSYNIYGFSVNDGINLVELFGLKPGDPFDCEEAAAIDALNSIKDSGFDGTDTEKGGLIYEKDGQYYATKPVDGAPRQSQGQNGTVKPFSTSNQVPKGGNITGIYHNHFQGLSGNFSPQDKAQSFSTQKNSYMTGTPPYDQGHKKHTPPKPKPNEPFNPNVPDSQDPNVKKLPNNPNECPCKKNK